MKKRHQNLWDAARAVLREKCIALNALKKILKKRDKINNTKKTTVYAVVFLF